MGKNTVILNDSLDDWDNLESDTETYEKRGENNLEYNYTYHPELISEFQDVEKMRLLLDDDSSKGQIIDARN